MGDIDTAQEYPAGVLEESVVLRKWEELAIGRQVVGGPEFLFWGLATE